MYSLLYTSSNLQSKSHLYSLVTAKTNKHCLQCLCTWTSTLEVASKGFWVKCKRVLLCPGDIASPAPSHKCCQSSWIAPFLPQNTPFCPKCKNKLSNILVLKSLYSKLKISWNCYLHGRWLEMIMKHDFGNFTSNFQEGNNDINNNAAGVEGVVCTSSSST